MQKKVLFVFLLFLSRLMDTNAAGAPAGPTKPSAHSVSALQDTASTNANLASLWFSAGYMDPGFDPATTSYEVEVENSVWNITVVPGVSDPHATVAVNGLPIIPGISTGSFSLNVGDNTFTIIVTAEDGVTTKTYTAKVIRSAPPPPVGLSNIMVLPGTLSPAFSPDTHIYNVSVGYVTDLILINPVINEGSNTQVSVNGLPFGLMYLQEGANYFMISVTGGPFSSVIQSYMLIVTREFAPNLAPTGLALSSLSVQENGSIGTVVGTFSATDPNANDTFTWSLVSGDGSTDNAVFSISGNQLKINESPDYETKKSYHIRARVSDQGLLYMEKTLTITVVNRNEFAPVITSHGAAASVNLVVPENTIVATWVAATDGDSTTLLYSLAGEDATKFKVNSSTGELSFITAPDFEHPGDANSDNAYIVTVQVSDGDSIAAQRFKIKVTDTNDNTPIITSYNGDAAVTLLVPENTTTTVATVKATDVDKNTTITYSLANEEDATRFTVNSITGELSFLAAPDYEQAGDGNGDNIYIVTVKASDGDLAATQRFKVKVKDVNDNAPVITSSDGKDMVTIQVVENMAAAVSTITAMDADITSTITYSIVNGEDGTLFSINPVTGMLRFIAAPDYEQPADGNHDNVYIVIVQASDGDYMDTQQFEITVTNINDSPLIITSTMQVAENTLVVTTLGAVDADAGIIISIAPGDDGDLFSFNPATGALGFVTAPDFEHPADANGDNVYVVAIKMSDGSVTTILRLNITVIDAGGSSARMTGHGVTAPEVQSMVVLQMEAGPGPGKTISVYPNPVTGRKFNLGINNIAAGNYTIEIYTTGGQLVCKQQLHHTGKSVLYPVLLPGGLAGGIYILKLAGANLRYTERLVVE